jgi:RND superfamily putative drug exporter
LLSSRLALAFDATIVRALLVPAFMRIAGKANWWAPSWLRKVHQRVGLQDG